MSNASLSHFGVFVSVIVVSVNLCRHALGPSLLHPTLLIAALQKHCKTHMHVDRPHTSTEQDISSVNSACRNYDVDLGEILDGLLGKETHAFLLLRQTGQIMSQESSRHPHTLLACSSRPAK